MHMLNMCLHSKSKNRNKRKVKRRLPCSETMYCSIEKENEKKDIEGNRNSKVNFKGLTCRIFDPKDKVIGVINGRNGLYCVDPYNHCQCHHE